MNELCTLQYEKAVKLIQNRPQVYYRHGVWNQYGRRDAAKVISSIMNSGYGADVFEEDGELYVSVPAGVDMW